jgi:hypothetical protein
MQGGKRSSVEKDSTPWNYWKYIGSKQGRTQTWGRGLPSAGLQPPPPTNPIQPKFKKHRICRYYDIKSFTWFPLQPKSAIELGWWLVHQNFEKYVNKITKQEDRTLWLSHVTCTYISMHINRVANRVMLCLQQDFYNNFLNPTYVLYTASGLASPPPPKEKLWVSTWL